MARCGAWVDMDVELLGDFLDATKQAKNLDPVAEGRWGRASGGEKGKRATFRCVKHTNCGRYLRVIAGSTGFKAQIKGNHSGKVKLKARRNSALTLEQETQAKFGINGGMRPGQLRASLTKVKVSELADTGKTNMNLAQEKRPTGGLIGEILRSQRRSHHPPPPVSTRVCILACAYSRVHTRVCILGV